MNNTIILLILILLLFSNYIGTSTSDSDSSDLQDSYVGYNLPKESEEKPITLSDLPQENIDKISEFLDNPLTNDEQDIYDYLLNRQPFEYKRRQFQKWIEDNIDKPDFFYRFIFFWTVNIDDPRRSRHTDDREASGEFLFDDIYGEDEPVIRGIDLRTPEERIADRLKEKEEAERKLEEKYQNWLKERQKLKESNKIKVTCNRYGWDGKSPSAGPAV